MVLDTKNEDDLVDYIFKRHYINCVLKPVYEKELKEEIKNQIHEQHRGKSWGKEVSVKLNDWWTTRNRVVQYIINALRLYEYFDLEWRLPFWDKRFLDFWYALGIENRKDCNYYIKAIFKECFLPYHVDYKKPSHIVVRSYRDSKMKKLMLSIYDKLVFTFGLKMGVITIRRNNINNYNYACHLIYQKIKKKRYITKPKGIMSFFTIFWCEQKYGNQIIDEVIK